MIKRIEELCSKLGLEALCDRGVLANREIPVNDSRPSDYRPAGCSIPNVTGKKGFRRCETGRPEEPLDSSLVVRQIGVAD